MTLEFTDVTGAAIKKPSLVRGEGFRLMQTACGSYSTRTAMFCHFTLGAAHCSA